MCYYLNMLFLILAILCSAVISILMRLSEAKRKSEAGMLIFNYVVCTLLGLFFARPGSETLYTDGIGYTVAMGAVSGVLFLLSFALFQKNIKDNGIVLASIFMKLGLIIPIIMAIFVFAQLPGPLQILGLILAVFAIVIFNYDKEGMKLGKSMALLILLLVAGGLADSMINVFNETGVAALSDLFLVFTFGFAGICSVVMLLISKQRIGKWDIIFGIIVGIPNYFSSKFLLAALGDVPAVIAYPVYSVTTLIIISIAGIAFFKESFTKFKLIGFILVAGALILLQI